MLVLNPFIIISWILFTALFPVSFYWLRNAYKIFVKKDYSKVALKKDEPPKKPAKWAPFVGLLNLAAGIAIIWAIIGALPFWFIYSYEKWTGIAAVTIWFKLFGEYIIKTHAHPFKIAKKNNN